MDRLPLTPSAWRQFQLHLHESVARKYAHRSTICTRCYSGASRCLAGWLTVSLAVSLNAVTSLCHRIDAVTSMRLPCLTHCPCRSHSPCLPLAASLTASGWLTVSHCLWAVSQASSMLMLPNSLESVFTRMWCLIESTVAVDAGVPVVVATASLSRRGSAIGMQQETKWSPFLRPNTQPSQGLVPTILLC